VVSASLRTVVSAPLRTVVSAEGEGIFSRPFRV
jgi:hypothetical protein